ncbi:hypothetical protein Zmor_026325 [Zophobas morio]|uniref:Uncharacterized protein n=1 Tax=Zophobas morio TaxID=2755281 RepID=A0AA38HTV3_9CUCU|nr:hypothetical protein Zmor_026325 [Zophobas morio]
MKLSLTVVRNLCLGSLSGWPLVGSDVFSGERHLIGKRLNAWYIVIRSPLLRLSEREHRFICFSLLGYDGRFLPIGILESLYSLKEENISLEDGTLDSVGKFQSGSNVRFA